MTQGPVLTLKKCLEMSTGVTAVTPPPSPPPGTSAHHVKVMLQLERLQHEQTQPEEEDRDGKLKPVKYVKILFDRDKCVRYVETHSDILRHRCPFGLYVLESERPHYRCWNTFTLCLF